MFNILIRLLPFLICRNISPHAGRAHTFLKLKKYAKKFAARLRLPRQCKAEVESYQFLQLPLWAIMVLLVNGLRVVPFSGSGCLPPLGAVRNCDSNFLRGMRQWQAERSSGRLRNSGVFLVDG